jgi:O-antigen/teichoic acid export membrane protein
VYFFSRATDPVAWGLPWVTFCLLGSVLFLSQGLLFLLEGCHRVGLVYSYRLLRSVTTSCCQWLVLYAGGGLWAPVAGQAVALLLITTYLLPRCKPLVRQLLGAPSSGAISWKRELLPFQSKLAISFGASYFVTALFAPMAFRYHGAVLAGQVGLTVAISASVPWIGYALVQPRLPKVATLIAQRRYTEVDRFFRTLSATTLAGSLLGCAAVIAVVCVMNATGLSLRERFLPLAPTALFVAGAFGRNVLQLERAYLRAHKQESAVWVTLAGAGLTALTSILLIPSCGGIGAGLAFAGTAFLFEVPATSAVVMRKRAEWHSVSRGPAVREGFSA